MAKKYIKTLALVVIYCCSGPMQGCNIGLPTATLHVTEVVVYWLPDPVTQSVAVGMQVTVRIKVSRDSPV
jgi:hypothetical protein